MQVLRPRDGPLTMPELIETMRPVAVSDLVVREAVALFRAQGILSGTPEGRLLYRPASPAVESAVGLLLRAYNERPVTLIRTVYAIADAKKIQAFADAFKLKRDE